MARVKMAMHNDPNQRKLQYARQSKIHGPRYHEGRMEAEGRQAGRQMSRAEGVTWAKGKKIDDPNIDDTSRKILAAQPEAGTSIFDPFLCELVYRWFSAKGGTVLDPFAGGSVRGIVASRTGRRYVGIDLRKEQVKANQEQGKTICNDNRPKWICGDSVGIEKLCAGTKADLVFSCPPYADLEVYSNDPKDLSNMPYPEFREAYEKIILGACALLKPNRFACFVVGEVRSKKDGTYRGLVPDTIRAFEKAGLKFYNEAILVTAIGFLPIRAGRAFEASRKIGKTHQNMLVFVKGDWKEAVKSCGECKIESIEDASQPESSRTSEAPVSPSSS